MKIKTRYLIITASVLFIIYLLSFTNLFKSSNKKAFNTALLNPKYKNEVTSIELSQGNEQIFLKKISDFWVVKTEEKGFSAPADNKRIENFLEQLSSIINMYKISDKLSKNNALGFEKSDSFYIKCAYKDTYSEFIFGAQDFSQNFRYFMTGKTTAVFQTANQFEPFLTASERYWTEAELISKTITKNISSSDIQRITINDFQNTKILTPDSKDFKNYASELLELRHGGIFKLEEFADDSITEPINISILRIKLELGNKDEIILEVYKGQEENCRLSVYYPKIKYEADLKISPWTLSKLYQK